MHVECASSDPTIVVPRTGVDVVAAANTCPAPAAFPAHWTSLGAAALGARQGQKALPVVPRRTAAARPPSRRHVAAADKGGRVDRRQTTADAAARHRRLAGPVRAAAAAQKK